MISMLHALLGCAFICEMQQFFIVNLHNVWHTLTATSNRLISLLPHTRQQHLLSLQSIKLHPLLHPLRNCFPTNIVDCTDSFAPSIKLLYMNLEFVFYSKLFITIAPSGREYFETIMQNTAEVSWRSDGRSPCVMRHCNSSSSLLNYEASSVHEIIWNVKPDSQ